MRMVSAILTSAAVTLAAIAAASASITVATNAARPALRVNARGDAEVSWTAGGVRRYLLVPARGRFIPGARLSGRDVSAPVSTPAIPYARALRRTSDGRLWALQAWRVAFAKSTELRFSRWRGAPTQLTLEAMPQGETEVLSGLATFQGRPVAGTSPTNAGKRILLSAFFDCFGCGATGWFRFNARRTARDGSFGVTVPLNRRGSRYRVSITGPNRGATLAPDANAVVGTSLTPGG
jgi:hypothetical protein